MAIHSIPISKGKGNIEVDTNEKVIPLTVYEEALRQGFKVLLNRGMSKITKETYPNAEELKAAAMAKAAANYEDLKAGKIRIMGAKADKVAGAVMTKARQMARAIIKDEMKARKIKVSYVEASEITKAANALIAANPEIIKQAEAALAAQEAEAAKLKEGLAQIVTPSMISAKKQKAAEDKKAKEKAEAESVLSAAKSGQIKATPKKGQGKPAEASA